MLVADRAQPLEIALRRHHHARGPRHRLDDHGGNGAGTMNSDDAFEFVGEMRAILRLALGEGLLFAVIGGRQVIDAGQQRAEHLAVVDHAADGNTAEADAVIAALAADQPGASGLAAAVVIGQRHLQRGIDRFGTGVAEKHMLKTLRRQRGDAAGKLEGLRMAELERWRVVEGRGLLLDRVHDRVAVMACIAAPHASSAVEDAAAIGGEVVHVLGAGEHARPGLERPVGRERHPESVKVVRRRDSRARVLNIQRSFLPARSKFFLRRRA